MSLKIIEQFAVQQLRSDIRDSLQSHGEQVVILAMRHAVSDADAERCPGLDCSDDIYNEGGGDCDTCYGSNFADPIREAAKVWAVFSDQIANEEFGKSGMWEPDAREMHTEAFPLLLHHDFVVRVRRWAPDGRIAEIEGFYSIGQVTANSIRTGDRFGQHSWDVVGQKASIIELPSSSAITRYPVLDHYFFPPTPPLTGIWSSPPVAPPVLIPNPTDVAWRQVLYFTQASPARTWTITHGFSTDPAVTLFIDGQQGDTQVDYPDATTVVLSFAAATAGRVQLVFTPAPGDPLTAPSPGAVWRKVVTHTQSAAATTWTISHVFDDLPSAALFVDGQEGDTGVAYPNATTVVLSFAEPQSGLVELV